MPLLLKGARQTGKTWLVNEFCRENSPNYFSVNLEKQPEYQSAFDDNLDPETIIRRLETLSGRRIGRSDIIFIDEIQECERAVTSLKYFCEDKNDYRIIGAGSLLGVKLSRFETSFPVGKIKILKMYPMDFEEFLIACGCEYLRDDIKDAYEKSTALPDGIHKKALNLYADYLFCGGMPELVLEYLACDGNINAMDMDIFDDLNLAYRADMGKYTISAAEGVKIAEVYDSIPRQLARENPKFRYKEVRPMANKRDFSSSLDWLCASGLVYKVSKVKMPAHPLLLYEEADNMKIYCLDVGILTHSAGLKMRDMMPDNHNIYKGAVTENYVVEQFASSGKNLNFYKPYGNRPFA